MSFFSQYLCEHRRFSSFIFISQRVQVPRSHRSHLIAVGFSNCLSENLVSKLWKTATSNHTFLKYLVYPIVSSFRISLVISSFTWLNPYANTSLGIAYQCTIRADTCEPAPLVSIWQSVCYVAPHWGLFAYTLKSVGHFSRDMKIVFQRLIFQFVLQLFYLLLLNFKTYSETFTLFLSSLLFRNRWGTQSTVPTTWAVCTMRRICTNHTVKMAI